MTRRLGVLAAAIVLIAAGLPAVVLAGPPSSAGGVEVSAAVGHAVSPPMRNLGPTAPSAANLRERPLRLVGPGSNPNQADGAVQAPAGTQIAVQPGGLSFDGVGVCGAKAGCWAPPDTNGAVGATQYVQWVNTAYAVFDKTTGTKLLGPIAGNAIWANLGGGCATNNDGDPIVQYDKIANRWILTQFSITGANGTSIPYLQCVAVSTTSDATGTYNLYAFSYGQFPDYPKLGVWPDAYYITFNMFTSTFVGPQVCAYDRASMLAGATATQQCFQLGSTYGAMLPGDFDGTFDGTMAPPSGAPNPVLALGTNSLNLWRFHVDWAHSGNTTLTGPTNIPVDSFSRACNGSNCVPQPGTNQKLDSLGDRLMYRLAYRRFGDGHESLVVNHSVSVGGNFFQSGVSSVRWYELRNVTSGTPSVYQQGTLGASDGIHRWMGSVAMDRAGDIALGFSASSGSVYPSIRYTGRVPTDPLGTMQVENLIQAGSGSQLQNLSRWGDYSAMTVDPIDDCTFWYTSEYLKTNGTWNWSTRIASFRFPTCGTPEFSLSASPSSQTVTQGGSTSYAVTVTPSGGFTGLVTLGVSGLPTSGATGTFSPDPTTGSSTLTVTTDSTTATGAYPLTVTGTSGSLTHTATATLVVNAPPTPEFSLSASPSSQTVTQGGSTSYAVTVTPSGGFTGLVTLGVSGLPTSGATGTFSPDPTTGSSTLTVTTDSTTATGAYPLTVTGTSGSLIHTTTVNLVVASASAGAPSAPQNLSARAGPGHGVSLSWSPPTSDGGSAIIGYRVYRGGSSVTSAMTLIASPGNVTTYKDGSTTRGSTYWYAITAFNAVGDGSFSTAAGPVTPTK